MDALPRYSYFLTNSPFRSPDWRWRRAQDLVARRHRLSPRRDDTQTIELVRYLRELAQCQSPRHLSVHLQRWSTVTAAFEIFQADDRQRWELEARLLAGQDDGALALKLHLDADVIRCYGDAFFDVRPYLHAKDWISAHVLRPGTPIAPTDLRRIWALFAFQGGPDILDVVMAVTLESPIPLRPTTALDRRLRLAVTIAVAGVSDPPAIPWSAQWRALCQAGILEPGAETVRLGEYCRFLDGVAAPKRSRPAQPGPKAAEPKASPDPIVERIFSHTGQLPNDKMPETVRGGR